MSELGSQFKSELTRNKERGTVFLREGAAWAKAQRSVAAWCAGGLYKELRFCFGSGSGSRPWKSTQQLGLVQAVDL